MSETQLHKAFRGACEDLGAISALLGFEEYPGVDALLRATTDLLTQAPTGRMSDEAFADKSIACSSCGLTMGESKFLAARKAEIERIDRAGDDDAAR